MDKDTLYSISQRLEKFRNDRDWSQFHEPKNLIAAISGEIGEINRLTQWLDDEQIYEIQEQVELEIADIMIYCLNLSLIFGTDIVEVINLKIDDNEVRYPVDKCKGKSTKAEDL